MIDKIWDLLFYAVFLFSEIALVSSDNGDAKIISGRDANKNEFPYMVSIQSFLVNPVEHICSGVLITRRHVLTCATCIGFAHFSYYIIEYMELNELFMIAGSRYKNANVKTIPTIEDRVRNERYAHEFFVHPGFNHSAYYGVFMNDVAIITAKLTFDLGAGLRAMPVYSSDPTVYGPAVAEMLNSRNTCMIAGWGSTSGTWNPHFIWGEAGSMSDILQVIQVKLISSNDCRTKLCIADKNYCKVPFDKLNQLCVTVEDEAHACKGDKGGALVCGESLFGVLGWYMRCGELNTPLMIHNLDSISSFYSYYSFQKHYGARGLSDRLRPSIHLYLIFNFIRLIPAFFGTSDTIAN